jgi:hypothetical protein
MFSKTPKQTGMKSNFTSRMFKNLVLTVLTLLSVQFGNAQTYTFTNASATGRFGPTQAQCNAAYGAGVVTVTTQGIQEWTVPTTGNYNIKAVGAGGGQPTLTGQLGGRGAEMNGEVFLTAGQILKIVVGQQGLANQYTSSGGGGSFVTLNDNTPFVIAGGGGGGGDSGGNGFNASIGTSGTFGYPGFVPGVGGFGSVDPSNGGWGQSGAGLLGNGNSTALWCYEMGAVALGFINGAIGSEGNTACGFAPGSCTNAPGSFGGGAQGACNGGGGGGGYSGGAAGGGGGGSFNGGANQINLAGVNAGMGSVIITRLAGGSPEMNVLGNGTSIVDGDVTPDTADDTDFGSVLTCSGTIVKTFTIENIGTSDLTLTTPFTVTGAGFSVSLPLATVIPSLGSTTFDVTFDPSVDGVTAGTISIANDDSDENPYNFSIQGTGLADVTAPVPSSNLLPAAPASALANVPEALNYKVAYELSIDNATSYINGANYTVDNSGVIGSNHTRVAYYMELDGQWVWVSMDDFAGGSLPALAIPNITTNNTVFDQTVANMNVMSNVGGVVTGSGILTGNIEMWRFDYSTTTNNGIGGNGGIYDFDDANAGAGQFGSFQVHNYGASQTLFALNQFNQVGPKDLGIGNGPGQPDWTFSANSNTYTNKKLYILVNNTASGLPNLNAECSLTPVAPTALDNCAGVVTGTTGTAFPITAQGTTTVTWTYDDGNGNTATQAQNVVISDVTPPVITCPANISVNNDPGVCNAAVTYVAPIGTDNCAGVITTQTDVTGLSSGSSFPIGTTILEYTTTDVAGNTDVCSFTVTVNSPEIDVQGNALSIVNGDVTPSLTDNTIMGNVLVCTGTVSQTYTIFNNGTSNLNLGAVTLTGANFIDFTLTTPPSSPVLPGTTTSFTVTCDPSVVGNRNTTVTIPNNDCNESPYTFLIRCIGDADLTAPTVTASTDVVTTTSADGTGNCTSSIAIVDALFNDNCPSVLSWVMTGAYSGSGFGQVGTFAFPSGVTTITYTYTNTVGGASASDAMTVTVTDNESPTVTSVGNVVTTTSADGTGNCTVAVAVVNAVINDNCSSNLTWVMTGATSASGSGQVGTYTFPIGVTTITYTNTDGAGLTATSTRTITVTDNEAPNISTCPVDITVNNDLGTCGAIVNFTPIGTDNCSFVFSYNQNPGTVFPVGPTTVIITATDPAGNTDVCSLIITVNDNEDPIAICQNVTVNLDAAGNGTTTAAAVNNVSTDNCGIASLSLSQTAFVCSEVGTNAEVLTITDVNGNISTCNTTITVVDPIAPVALCQNVTVNLDAAGNGSTTAALVNNGSADACGIASLSLSPNTFTCANVGGNTVTLTVTDVNSNSSTCTAIATVNDFIAPNAICQNISVDLNAAGTVTVPAGSINNASNDACGIALIQINGGANQIYTCANVGANTATLTITDNNLNVSTCTATVTVNDITLPNMVCNNITVPLNASGNASITVAMIDGGTTDACGLAGLSVIPNNFTCVNVGINSVTLIAIDNNGNSNTCTSTVTIQDNILPTAICQPVTVQLNAAGSATVTAAAVNNGSFDNCGIASMTVSPNAFTCAMVGNVPVTLTVTDNSGNVSTCNTTVTVQDNIAPTAICQNVSVNLNALGSVIVPATSINNASTDNCGIGLLQINGGATQAFTCANLGANTVTLTVVDDNSNISTCVATVTVNDIIAPVAICQPFTVALNASGNATITAANINNGSTDNCSIATMSVSPSSFTCANVGSNVVTLTVTDPAGNTSTCTAVVTVQDNTVPVVVCPSNIVQNAIVNNCGKIVNYTVGVTDNCATVTQTDGTGLTAGSLFPVGITNQSYTITDAGGNTVFCNFTVTILDIQNPTITGCPANIVVSNDLNNCNANVFWTAPTASDNCSGVILTASILPGSNFPLGTTPVTYTATDASGLFVTCTFTVTVNDTQLPTITCPAAIAVNTDPGVCFATVSLGTTVTADNCGVATVTNNAPATFPVGPTTVTWTVTDVNLNIQTCTQVVTVTDNVNPIAICQNVIVNLNAAGNGTTTAAAVNNGSSDICGIASLVLSQTAFTCANVGSNPVTLTVTDVNGNVSTCSATATVNDFVAPNAVCQNVTVNLDASGNGSTTAALVNNGSTDACGIASMTLSQTAFVCSEVGANPEVLTVTDVNGNVSTCPTIVTVIDGIAPIALCQNVIVNLDVTGNGSTTAALVNNGSSDACGIATMTLSQTAFTCSNIGTNPNSVTLTVTDVNGNIGTCVAVVTVADTIDPSITCPGDITVNNDPGVCGAVVNYVTPVTTDNCSGSGTQIYYIPISQVTPYQSTNGPICTAGTDVWSCGQNIGIQWTSLGSGTPSSVNIEFYQTWNNNLSLTTSFNGFPDAPYNWTGIGGCNISNVNLAISPSNYNVGGLNNLLLNVPGCIVWDENPDPTWVPQSYAKVTVNYPSGSALTQIQTAGLASGSTFPVGTTTNTFVATDASGNTDTCSFVITVIDVEPPIASCQNFTLNLDGAGDGTISVGDINAGSTDNCGIASTSLNITSFDCSNLGANSVILTVTDIYGLVSTCTSTVTVVDNVLPNAICSNITVQLNAAGTAMINGVDVDGGSTDNCSISTYSVTPNTFDCTNIGSPVNVTLTVTDQSGNSSTCTSTVTVADTIDPVAVCQNVNVILDVTGNGSTTAILVNNGSSDACGIASMSLSQTAFVCSEVGPNTETLTVTDVNGNVSTCTTTITVIDNIAPVALCQPITVSLNALGSASITAFDIDFGSNDACGVALSASMTSFGCINLGPNNVTLTVIDPSLNSSTCVAVVTVQDLTAPIIVCQDITVQLNTAGAASIVPANITASASDNCAIASSTIDVSTFTCANIGPNTVTLTVTDQSGNISTCTAIVTVADTVDPVAICQDITVQLNALGTVTILDTDINNGSNDACGIASIISAQTVFSCSNVGLNNVVLTVTDNNGNVSTCVAKVTVEDNVAPIAICQDISVTLNSLGTATITAAMIDNGSTDACGIASLVASQTSFNCSNVGTPIIVTLTVTDVNSNVSTCLSTVTVIDTVPPVITCPINVVVSNDPGLCNASSVAIGTATAVDNCTTVFISNNGIPVYPFGVTNVTWTAADVYGNTATCIQTVTVIDVENPIITCSGDITVSSDAGICTASLVSLVNPLTSDNCAVASVTNDAPAIYPLGSTNVTWTVVDAQGNSATCTQVVTVIDTEVPTITCSANVTVPALFGTCNAVGLVLTAPVTTDNCSIVSVTNNAPVVYPLGTTFVTWTVTDGAGNTAICTQSVTVTDTQVPTITCSPAITVPADAGSCAAVIVLIAPTTADNCSVASVTNNAPGSFPLGNTTVTWTVTDGSGNTATCTQLVTVIDTELPTITCPVAVTVPANAGSCIATGVVLGTPIANDNCSVIVTNDAPVAFALGANTVTWTATDAAGNTATCTQLVTVTDTQFPTITCPANVTVNAATGLCSASSVALGTPVTADNCSIASVTNNGLAVYPVGSTSVTWTVVDGSGNITTCIQTVTVLDTQLPTIACSGAITVPADLNGCAATGVLLIAPTAADNCSIASVTNNAPGSFPLGNTTVTWIATDASGNTASCTQVVTVIDTQMPTITCPVAVTVPANAGTCVAIGVVLGIPTANDNCSVVVTNNAPATYPLGNTTVTWTATDGSGNSTTCTQIVTVIDNQFPTIACPANVTVNASAGLCSASSVALGTPVTADNCSIASVTNNALLVYPLGVTNVTWTIVDGSGNTTTCVQTVTVVDTQNPTIACSAPITVAADLGSCVATGVVLVVPTTADNCSIASVSNNAPVAYPLGNTTVTWTATDGSGNTSTCTQVVTVIDTQLPTITCPIALTVPANVGSCVATGVVLGLPVTADNCSVASTTNNAPATFPLGATTVTWTVTDGSGNTASCTQVITVVDTQAPTITCPIAITVPANAGSCVATGVVLGMPTSADNCSVASVVNNAPATFPLGVTTVIWTVTDGSGNTTNCTQFVTVVDTQLPTIVCSAPITVPANLGSCVATGVVLVIPTTADNCSVASVTNNAPATYPLGNTTVTWTVTDGSGNIRTCTQVVTVIDTQMPTIACPANVIAPANAGICNATGVVLGLPVTADNCSVASVTNNGLATYPLGVTNVTWTVVDGSGNTTTCIQTVTIVDTQNPVIACPANVIVSTGGGSCSATGVALGTPFTSDNCSVASVTNNGLATYPIGTTNVVWTVVDGSGNVATCTQTVTVQDHQNPTIACPFPVTVNANVGSCTALSSGVALGTPLTADNCTVATVTNNAPVAFPLGTTTVTWTVTDGSGNTASCTQTVTVVDNQAPTIACPANVTVNAAAGLCSASGVALGTPLTADNCSVASVTNNALSVYPLGTTSVTWTVVDGSGNVSTCVQTVTVVDTQLPTITCPAAVTVAANLGSCIASGVALGLPTTSDNCSVASVTNNAPATYPLGNTTVTWIVTDGSGNTATCTQLVTVLDTQNPTIVCAPAVTVSTDPALCSAVVVLTAPSVADNCSVASVSSNAPVGMIFPLGTTTVTWTVIDGSGNTTLCTQTVTVLDTEIPTIACPADITVNNMPGFCGRSVNYITPAHADNCSIASFTQTDGSGYVSGDLFPIGVTYQEFTVVDNSGNSYTCGFNITVIDNEMPVVSNCPSDMVVFITEAAQCEQTASWNNPTFSDNCPGINVTQDYVSGSSFPIGITVVTYTGVDNAGNSVSCSFSVTVLDQANPIVSVVNGSKLIVNVTSASSYQWVDCDNGYAPIAGATGSSFTPAVSGNYGVIVSNGSCADTSNCEAVTVTNTSGVEEIAFEDLYLYPNPTIDGNFRINYSGNIISIMVYDMTGREVSLPVDTIEKAVDGSQLATGKYMVRILTENQVVTKELVVVHKN